MGFFDIRTELVKGVNVIQAVGQRNCGKNYSTAHFIYDIVTANSDSYIDGDGLERKYPEFLKPLFVPGAEFIYMRRYVKNELRKTKNTFFDYEDLEKPIVCDGEDYYIIDGDIKRHCGYAFSLSTFPKGTEFPKVTVVVFDEYTITEQNVHYLPGEFEIFAKMLESVCRRRTNVLFILLGNAKNFFSPYTNGWGINLTDGQKRWRSPNGRVKSCLAYATGREAERSNTLAGSIFAGTTYDKWAGNNEFTDNTTDNVKTKPANAKYWCSIKYDSQLFTIWYDGRGMYVSNSKGEKRAIYSLDKENLKEGEFYFTAQNNQISRVKFFAQRGLLFYENLKIKDAFRYVIGFILRY